MLPTIFAGAKTLFTEPVAATRDRKSGRRAEGDVDEDNPETYYGVRQSGDERLTLLVRRPGRRYTIAWTCGRQLRSAAEPAPGIYATRASMYLGMPAPGGDAVANRQRNKLPDSWIPRLHHPGSSGTTAKRLHDGVQQQQLNLPLSADSDKLYLSAWLDLLRYFDRNFRLHVGHQFDLRL